MSKCTYLSIKVDSESICLLVWIFFGDNMKTTLTEKIITE